MHTYSAAYTFPLFCHLFFLLPICFDASCTCTFLFITHFKSTSKTHNYSNVIMITRKLPVSTVNLYNIMYNIKFDHHCLVTGAITIFFKLGCRFFFFCLEISTRTQDRLLPPLTPPSLVLLVHHITLSPS